MLAMLDGLDDEEEDMPGGVFGGVNFGGANEQE